MKKNCFLLLFLLCACLVQAQNTYRTDKDIAYVSGSETDAYRLERCKLDIYYPENKKDFSTIVWFHGGGMEGGSKFVPKELTDQGFAVVAVNYRLSPRAKNPAYIEDAAEAVAWTFKNIEKYGGRKDRIFVSGHSAGGYINDMGLLPDNKRADIRWCLIGRRISHFHPTYAIKSLSGCNITCHRHSSLIPFQLFLQKICFIPKRIMKTVPHYHL